MLLKGVTEILEASRLNNVDPHFVPRGKIRLNFKPRNQGIELLTKIPKKVHRGTIHLLCILFKIYYHYAKYHRPVTDHHFSNPSVIILVWSYRCFCPRLVALNDLEYFLFGSDGISQNGDNTSQCTTTFRKLWFSMMLMHYNRFMSLSAPFEQHLLTLILHLSNRFTH